MTTELDPYGRLGEKYRFLLQLPPGAPVRVSGRYWEPLAEDFLASGLQPVALTDSSVTQPGSILCAFVEAHGHEVHPRFGDRFPPRGKAVVLIRRRLVPAGWVRNQVRRAAGRAGLAVRAEFLPVPNLDQVEAFLIRDRDPTEWRLGRSPRLPVSLRQPREHVFFLAPADGATGFSEAARLLSHATGDHDFSVER
ncbi:MAG TPA: hypothetical protein VGA78_02560, partial [Gemmatimonadales bacterium]